MLKKGHTEMEQASKPNTQEHSSRTAGMFHKMKEVIGQKPLKTSP